MQNTKLRAKRIAALQQALYQQRVAAKQQRYQAAQAAYNQHAYALAVQQLAAQYGVAVNNTFNARANSATTAPSVSSVTINGVQYQPCKAVHVLAAQHQNRKATLAACKALGINPSTASTQYQVWAKKQQATN